MGACGVAAGKPLSSEGVAAALGEAEAAGKPAVLLACPAEAESLEAEVAALEAAHAALKAWGKPHVVLYASQPVRPHKPYNLYHQPQHPEIICWRAPTRRSSHGASSS